MGIVFQSNSDNNITSYKKLVLSSICLLPITALISTPAHAQAPSNPTDVCSSNWSGWLNPDANSPVRAARFNPTNFDYTKSATSEGANTWYNAPSATPNFTATLTSGTAPAEQTASGTIGESFYVVTSMHRTPGSNASIDLADTGFNDGHAFAVFDSAGDLIGRYPTVTQVNSNIFYVSSDNNPGYNRSGVDPETIREGSSWSEPAGLTFTVPNDGQYFVHYIMTDESHRSKLALDAWSTCNSDFSDGPANGSPALAGGVTAYGIASHTYLYSGPMLGTLGASSYTSEIVAAVNSDDSSDDGIIVPTLDTGATSDVTINASDITAVGSGNLYGWIDFNGDGTFGPTEYATTTITNGVAAGPLTFSGYGTTAIPGTTSARFRLTSDTLSSSDFATAADDGEVEDYPLTIENPQPSLSMSKVADSAGPHNAGDVITYTYTVTNDGDQIIRDVAITDSHNGSDLAPTPGNETLLTDTTPTGDSTDAATNNFWDVLAPGDVITFTGTYTVTQADAENL